MPYFAASASGFPGVGEATATTSASSGMIWNDAAWMSASNWEPMIPTFTLPGMRAPPSGLDVTVIIAGPGGDVSGEPPEPWGPSSAEDAPVTRPGRAVRLQD